MISLFNSLTKKIESFTPIDPSEIKIYSCGPTVYDNIHIGNLVSFIYADTLNRALSAQGAKVKHVMNITDVDDKTIKRSAEDYPEESPEVALKMLSTKYELTFKSDIEKVGNRVDLLSFVRATDSIDIMQKLILELYKKNFAYIADDGIYFSIENYTKSGKKYGQLLDIHASNTSMSRINNDEYDKKSIHDFALWKFGQNNEPSWPFIIGGKDYLGRPGWHIECSAMSSNSLSQPFDIHTGGVDLIFPHHENEIAQSTAISDNPKLANFFFHNEHLLIENKKMSKSLGNIYNLSDIEEHEFNPIAFRLLVLQSHYRSQSEFNWDLLRAAQIRLKDLKNLSNLKFQAISSSSERKPYDFKSFQVSLSRSIEKDLNTPEALALVSEFNKIFEERLISEDELKDFKTTMDLIDNYLGLGLSAVSDITEDEKRTIKARDQARKEKDWAKSDQIRDELAAAGIGLRDSSFGTIWTRL